MCAKVNDREQSNVMVSRTYKWSIDDFSKESLKQEPLLSNVFDYKSENCGNEEPNLSSWSLKLYPNGFDNESKGYVCIEITLQCDDYDIAIHVDCKLSILKANNEETNSHYARLYFDSDDSVYTRRLFRNFIKLDSILSPSNGMLTNDKLILLFSIGIQEGQSVISMEESNYKSRLQLSNDFECFYNSKKFTDVTFMVADKEIQAHRSILAARSPIFFSMFSLDMKEKQEDSVKIDDVDPKVFKEMLKFMYTGKLHKYDLIEELLVVADKYAVESLQEVCEKYLSNTIRIDNAMDILQLADSYNAYDLKQKAVQFIIENAQYVIETDGFKNLEQPRVDLMKELFCALTNKSKDSDTDDEEVPDHNRSSDTTMQESEN